MKFSATNIVVTECRAVVAYCDVTGFSTWMNRSAVNKSDVKDFIRRMKWIFRQFMETTGFDTINNGDGMIAIVSAIDPVRPKKIFKFISSVYSANHHLASMIHRMPSPRPAGSRIRIAAGPVYRIEEPPLPGISTRRVDFLGSPMNTGSRLLEYRRDIQAMMTEQARAMLTSAELKKIALKKIKHLPDERPPRGIDPEELEGLCEFEMR